MKPKQEDQRVKTLRRRAVKLAHDQPAGVTKFEWLFILREAATEWNRHLKQTGHYHEHD